MSRVNIETPESPVTLPAKNSALRKRSNKSPVIKNEVVARRSLGQSKSQIARELNIAHNTVSSIVALSNIDEIMGDGRLGAMKRIPQALKTLDVRLEKNSESAALWLLDKCFDNQAPTGNRLASDVTLNQTLNVLLHSDPTSSSPAESANPEKLKSSVISDITIEPTKE